MASFLAVEVRKMWNAREIVKEYGHIRDRAYSCIFAHLKAPQATTVKPEHLFQGVLTCFGCETKTGERSLIVFQDRL